MENGKARAELSRVVSEYKDKSYSFWVSLVDAEPITLERTTADGTWFQVEIQSFWDGRPGEDVRVLFAIDDGGWRAFCPLTEDLIMRKDGTFVD